MSAQPQPQPRMTVDEFLVWSDGREGKYELVDGEVVAMAPERVRHAQVKAGVFDAVRAAIRAASLPCRALIDGVAVRVDAATSYVPDVLVYCGPPVHPDTLEIAAPMIVVEVLSPSSRSIDTNGKLIGYFRIPSLMHYLVVDPKGPLVIHHRREGDGIAARILSDGALELDPPGLTLAIADFFTET